MSRSTRWFLLFLAILAIVAVGFSLLFISMLGTGSDDMETTSSGSGGQIAVVELKGVIMESESIVRQLKRYREDDGIQALLLRVDSPGGGVVASQEIYEEVRKTRDGGMPVVVSMGSMAASGGYYVSCGASLIVANRGTLTGSVGVISEFMEFKDALAKLGIDVNTVKAGRLKDAGSPTRKMTDADKEYFQQLMDDVHRQFIGVVEDERGLTHDEAVELSDGRVFTGEQALDLGLVDTLGTYEDAVMIAASLGGIEGEPSIVRERKRRSVLDRWFGDLGETVADLRRELLDAPVISYRLARP
ncbi:MAG: multidrug transporter [Bacteroidetes bacterium]|jgi:protease-4|nr:multidrug transporter [Bacteroidota bacterium]